MYFSWHFVLQLRNWLDHWHTSLRAWHCTCAVIEEQLGLQSNCVASQIQLASELHSEAVRYFAPHVGVHVEPEVAHMLFCAHCAGVCAFVQVLTHCANA